MILNFVEKMFVLEDSFAVSPCNSNTNGQTLKLVLCASDKY